MSGDVPRTVLRAAAGGIPAGDSPGVRDPLSEGSGAFLSRVTEAVGGGRLERWRRTKRTFYVSAFEVRKRVQPKTRTRKKTARPGLRGECWAPGIPNVEDDGCPIYRRQTRIA